jgi:hypothetical protein
VTNSPQPNPFPGYDGSTAAKYTKPPRHRGRTIVIILAVIAVILGACSLGAVGLAAAGNHVSRLPVEVGPANASPHATGGASPSQSQGGGPLFNLKVGSAIQWSDDNGKLNVEVYKVARYAKCGTYDRPASGKEYLVIFIAAKVVSGTADVNPWDWAFTDANGDSPDMDIASCDSKAGTTEFPGDNGMHAGKSVKGYILFQVAKGHGGTLAYSPDFEEDASWVIVKK